MSNGLEKFENNWTSNQFYLNSFAPINIQDGGFNKLVFGSINLMTNVYTPALDEFSQPNKFTLPAYAKQLFAYVTIQTGAGVTPSDLHVSYQNSADIAHTISFNIYEGMTTGTGILLPLFGSDVGVLAINSVLRFSTVRSGIITFYGLPDLSESFQTNWGPADVGL